MSVSLIILLRLGFWILCAPLMPGFINRVKARLTGRQGPPVLQLYFDLHRLWRKGVVQSTLASPGFLIAPAVAWIATLAAAMLLPLNGLPSPLAFDGDVLLFLSLLALGRFSLVWGALETGQAFEGMGAAREISYAVITEIAFITALLTFVVQSGNLSLSTMFQTISGPSAMLLAAGLFIILLAENCRVPFDDPGTHLELTMIHEAMILDHSGPPLALIMHTSAVKLLLFAAILVQAVLMPYTAAFLTPFGAFVSGLIVVSAAVGFAESLTARLSLRRVPLLLTVGFLFCLFPLLLTWIGAI